MHVALSPVNVCWKFPKKVFNDILSIMTSQMTSVTHIHDVNTNFCKQIHWYKNTWLGRGLGEELTTELTSLDLNQAYPLGYSEYIH